MNYKVADYTFLGLVNHSAPLEFGLESLAYLVALVDSAQNEICDLDKTESVLAWLYEVEEQAKSAADLVSQQNSIFFPKGYFPQTPVMATLKWSPISEMLERGWDPLFLKRAATPMACASGIWKPEEVRNAPSLENCKTHRELFWHIMMKVVQKVSSRGLLLSVVAQPGWTYHKNLEAPCNFSLEEAKKADRVVWQRTPRPKKF
jgi:hypothetical protein